MFRLMFYGNGETKFQEMGDFLFDAANFTDRLELFSVQTRLLQAVRSLFGVRQ
jgi:hypothetical protein